MTIGHSMNTDFVYGLSSRMNYMMESIRSSWTTSKIAENRLLRNITASLLVVIESRRQYVSCKMKTFLLKILVFLWKTNNTVPLQCRQNSLSY